MHRSGIDDPIDLRDRAVFLRRQCERTVTVPIVITHHLLPPSRIVAPPRGSYCRSSATDETRLTAYCGDMKRRAFLLASAGLTRAVFANRDKAFARGETNMGEM